MVDRDTLSIGTEFAGDPINGKRKGAAYATPGGMFLDNVAFDLFHDLVQAAAVCMDVQVDRFGQIQAEDTHDGFCVDDVSSGYQVEIMVEFADFVDEGFYFID